MRRCGWTAVLAAPTDLLESANARRATISTTQEDVAALHVQFLTFEGCPLADATRIELAAALTECGIETYEELDILSPQTPENLRGWGSPTILVNGTDIAGQAKGDDVSCRVYPAQGGVLGRSEIASRIRKYASD